VLNPRSPFPATAAPAPPPLHGLFITGTDTGVGKSHVTATLLRALAAAGWQAGGLKPLAAGLPPLPGGGHGINEDVALLAAHGQALRDPALVGPCGWPEPCAPHVAARLVGERITPQRVMAGIGRAWQAMAAGGSAAPRALLVEGVGGFIVPLSDDDAPAWDTADLAAALGLPVVLVVGLRLGCLSHALLTAEAITARGLRLAGWVANRPLAEPMAHEAANVATLGHWLQRRFGAACWGLLPHDATPEAPVRAAAAIDAAALQTALRGAVWSGDGGPVAATAVDAAAAVPAA
jgi:dethiobiotin synthetase